MRRRAALLALAVLLAGCGGAFTTERPEAPPTPTGPAATATGATPAPSTASPTAAATPSAGTPTATPRPPTPTPRRAGKVAVSGLALSFDEEAVYRRVVALHDRSYASAPTVRLRVTRRPSSARTGQVIDTTPFLRLWGFDAAAVEETAVAGLAVEQRVFLYTAPLPSTAERKRVLAHEYAHVLQHDAGAFARVDEGVREGGGNARLLYLAVVEGAASYVEARYAAAHLDDPGADRTWGEFSGRRSRLGAYLVAPYYFGERYVRGRVDSVANLSAVYDRPPTTTEQLLHGYGRAEEPARPLSVDATADGGWSAAPPRPRGELVVRLVLEGRLDRDRAAAAAAGWGADRVVRFDHAEAAPGYAWVLRWDGPAEAEEFAAAMTDYLDARANRTGGRWIDGDAAFALRRVGAETVVVVAGPDRFVANATVGGESAAVDVGVAG